jgi:hypothetical protein
MANVSELSTEEQMRSAFEIADTDGDGVVTNAEAVEAVQALSTDSMDATSTPANLLSSIAPNLSFNEFVLVCNSIIQEEESRPLDRFRACIEAVVSSAHDCWGAILTEGLRRRLDLSMRLEVLGISAVFEGTLKLDSPFLFGKAFEASSTLSLEEKKRMCQKLFPVSMRGLQSTWVVETLDTETVLIPSAVSHSLGEFLLSLSKLSCGCVLSVYTIQEEPLYGLFDQTIKDDAIKSISSSRGMRLADRGFASILSQAVIALVNHFEVHDLYRSLLQYIYLLLFLGPEERCLRSRFRPENEFEI